MMRYVVIGASAAGLKAAALLRDFDSGSEITVISRDKEVYSRCMLHLRIAGERDDAGLCFVEDGFFEKRNIGWIAGESVDDILVDGKAVRLASGREVPYDKLLIATGSSASIPPVPNLRDGGNVLTLRDIDDVRALTARGTPGARAVIIGGGLVGVDAAVGLMELGARVTVVEMADRVLTMQLDQYAAGKYADLLRRHGAEVIVSAQVKSAVLDGGGNVTAILLGGGRSLPCDFCVVAAGVVPNTAFVRDSRIELSEPRRAVVVDRRCRTSVPDIYAAGDVTFIAPVWPEAVRQAEVAAANMAGREASLPEKDWAMANSMNFFGLPTVSYGRTVPPDDSYDRDYYVDGDVYRMILHRDGVIYGAVFQGDIDNCGVYLRLVRDQIPVTGTGKNVLDLNYADFFAVAANGEYV